ncbi:hypothetical protein MF628_002335 [Paenibacillus polymyxa]|uniref:hypothetical protein n=1 Tax=Paenibacillus polymyxa TaxID=1406 RepID=UPI0020243657|nr:hypothetical protein [Paenibacillus polymyxa]URJ47657.3 hypothetical protein MF628_002335 [Paenibacillus polymyxa]
MFIFATFILRILRLREKRDLPFLSFPKRIFLVSYYHLLVYPFLISVFFVISLALLVTHEIFRFSQDSFEMILLLSLLMMPLAALLILRINSKRLGEENYLKWVKTAIEANEYLYWIIITGSSLLILKSGLTTKTLFVIATFPFLAKSKAVKFYVGYRLSKLDEIQKLKL